MSFSVDEILDPPAVVNIGKAPRTGTILGAMLKCGILAGLGQARPLGGFGHHAKIKEISTGFARGLRQEARGPVVLTSVEVIVDDQGGGSVFADGVLTVVVSLGVLETLLH